MNAIIAHFATIHTYGPMDIPREAAGKGGQGGARGVGSRVEGGL